MAVTFLTGFEVQQVATDGIGALNGTASYNTTGAYVRTGAASLRCNPSSGNSGYVGLITALSGTYVHFGLYIASLPSTGRRIFGLGTGLNMTLASSGKLTLYDGSTQLVSTASGLSTGEWHWIGIANKANYTGVLLQVDGNDEGGTATTGTSTGQAIGCSATEATAIDIYFDDVITDSAGFLASSNVALLVPISDNGAAGTALWRLGNGSALGGNGYLAVNSIPPNGVASASETATTNIEHPGSGASGDYYRANLTTYTTAGVGTDDTVIAYQPLLRHGEDINTGTKQLALQQNSNPNIGQVWTGAAGADGGAHAAEVGVWKTNGLVYTTFGSLTFGSSPVLEVQRYGSESRVACVDFMGAYIAWTPYVAPPAGGEDPFPYIGGGYYG